MTHPAIRRPTKEVAAVEIYGKRGQSIVALKNMSSTGACLEQMQEPIALIQGDLIRMTVVLKSLNRKHLVSAEVVWSNGAECGISFIPADKVLDRLIQRDL